MYLHYVNYFVNENRKGQQKGQLCGQNQIMVIFIRIRAYLKCKILLSMFPTMVQRPGEWNMYHICIYHYYWYHCLLKPLLFACNNNYFNVISLSKCTYECQLTFAYWSPIFSMALEKHFISICTCNNIRISHEI